MAIDDRGLREVLLRKQGLVFIDPGSDPLPDDYVRAVEIKLAELGYLPSARLRNALGALSIEALTEVQEWIWSILVAGLGADQEHVPLFRKFPEDVPDDTYDLWVRKVISHFAQGQDQPCLFCGTIGTTHVLNPCHHVVCDQCFDGSNYSACPICERQVDTTSPFFRPTPTRHRERRSESKTFQLLDLGSDIEASARDLFLSFCQRGQAMSPSDKEDLGVLLRNLGERTLTWIPEQIPVRENAAIIFGILLQEVDREALLPFIRNHMATATDALRLIAAYSNADPSLQAQTITTPILLTRSYTVTENPEGLKGKIENFLGLADHQPISRLVTESARGYETRQVNRFRVARLGRPLRRELLAMLESLHPDAMVEDMLRHRSHWVWVGEFLHPHEYAKRFPNTARAFSIIRRKNPDGSLAPIFRGYYGRLDAAFQQGDSAAVVKLLRQRPGELARRFDHALRTASDDPKATEQVLGSFSESVGDFSTPVLLTLRNFLPTRTHPAKVRVFWPKGQTTSGVSSPDKRAPLSQNITAAAVAKTEEELLNRFSKLRPFETWIVDKALKDIPAPFNERTASRSSVVLPRGSRIQIPDGKVMRLFLHWCQPRIGGHTTDLDLSVGFYDANWQYAGVCSYYQLKFKLRRGKKNEIAVSAGDRQDAPYPNGATEFIDLHRDRSLDHGLRYAVMVVNAYAGLPFSRLDRCFAGLMLRDEVGGKHFDPSTVELKFDLQGERGIYLPFVLDIEENHLHWLDVFSKGQFIFNNVETSNRAITRICPDLLAYFGSGIRLSMYELALLHAAARGKKVLLRSETIELFERRPDEDVLSYYSRLANRVGGQGNVGLPRPGDGPVFAALFKGDIELGDESVHYALFRESLVGSISASDLIAGE